MHESINLTIIPSTAATLNLAILLWTNGKRRPILYTALKCVTFAGLTGTMLHNGIVPTRALHQSPDPGVRFLHGLLETGWWLLASATIMSVVRTYYAVPLRLRQHRFLLDVVATLLYLGSAIAIVSDVLDIPLQGVLATSGALAIVLGLALQSTLSDLFSGLLINATSPYRIGDTVTLDDSTEGEVVEVTWRATHIAKANRDLVVVPNSIIAKSRIVNRTFPDGPHATVAKFDASTDFRPSDVVHALELAMETCIGVAARPKPTVTTTLVGRKSTSYEITFFPTGQRSGTELLNKFYDAAHRHLESLSVLVTPIRNTIEVCDATLEYRLVRAIGVFGLLSRAQQLDLSAALVRREYAPGQVLLTAGETSRAIVIVGYGIVGASVSENADTDTDIVRLAPREYFGEGGPIAGVPSLATFVARTYVIAYELPASAIGNLLEKHSDVAHALAAQLVARERKGHALIQTAPDVQTSHNGLLQWFGRCIRSLHHRQG
jgi:small-conductance mechanosensitive channel